MNTGFLWCYDSNLFPGVLPGGEVAYELYSNKRPTSNKLPRRRSFLKSILQKPCFVCCFVRVLLLSFIVLLQNKHTALAENGENLISA